MATVVKKSGLLAKYKNLDGAVKKHAGDETKYGGLQRLPPGIVNGVCQITECGFREYDKDTKQKKADGTSAAGEYYFYARGTMIEPESVTHNGQTMPVSGLQTSIMEPLCDTKRGDKIVSQEEHVANVLNEMRKLGQETADASAADLENLAAGIQEGRPYFNVSTSVKAAVKNPDGSVKYEEGVWENWNGNRLIPADYTPPSGAGGDQVDETGGGSTGGEDHQQQEDTSSTSGGEPDLDQLIQAAADGTDEDSKELKAYAAQFGVAEDDIDNAADWDAAKAIIEAARDGGGDAGEPAKEEFVPKVKGVCKYAPPDAKDKTGKKRLKPADCDVTAVDTKKKTASLKNLTTKAIYKDVPWSELEEA